MDKLKKIWTTRLNKTKSDFIRVYDKDGNEIFSHTSPPNLLSPEITNVFSCTKSFVGLMIAHEYLHGRPQSTTGMELKPGQFPINVKITPEILHLVGLDPVIFKDHTLMMFINHVSGMISGADPGKFGAADAMYILKQNYLSCIKIIRDNVHDVLPESERKFKYDNYGSQVGGMIFECLMRYALGDPTWLVSTDSDIFYVCEDTHDWPACDSIDPYKFTSAASGVSVSPHDFVNIGMFISAEHEDDLKYIYGDTIRGIKNVNVVDAHTTNVTPGQKHVISLEYKYSFGWWIPQLDKRVKNRVVTTIGMMGNYITIDVDEHWVAVRKCVYVSMDNLQPINHYPAFAFHATYFMHAVNKISKTTNESEINEICKEFEALISF